MSASGGDPLLLVEHLSVDFPTDDGVLHAVDDVSFSVTAHETLGIVGESGSGKTVTSMAILGLLPKRARVTGRVMFEGTDLRTLEEKDLEKIRGAPRRGPDRRGCHRPPQGRS
jgi:peptide/nickel transport system ATP-binding protein